MDELTKDYMLDQAMASILATKRAIDVVNKKHPDKSKRLTPTQKLKYFNEFIDNEYDRIMKEYEKYN